jgi:hypothetical protein
MDLVLGQLERPVWTPLDTIARTRGGRASSIGSVVKAGRHMVHEDVDEPKGRAGT